MKKSKEVIGKGAYDSKGHRNTQFMDETDVGPCPKECRKALTSARNEAMKNLRLRDDPEKEGWEKMGQLAEPTPANTKNRGAAKRKKRRGEENRTGDEEGTATNAIEAVRAEERSEGPETEAQSEMEEIREAVAEAIQEMETDATQ